MLSLTSGLSAQTTLHPVRISAKVKSEHGDHKSSNAEILKKHLEIELTGSSALQGEVKVISTFFADDLGADRVVPLKTKEIKAEVGKSRSTRITSSVVTFSYTRKHSERSGTGRRARFKSVEATGKRYHGWGVQVFSGNELVGEAFSSREIQKLLAE